MEKLTRFNPIANWTPEVLTQQLVAYSRGEIAALARVMEWLEQHDEVIATVAPKAKAAVSRHGYDVLLKDEVPNELKGTAEEQQSVVQSFYQNLRTSDAVDAEQCGGMRLLVQQIMDGYGKGFAAHHIIWQPGQTLGAALVKVPTWFFECKTGRLRFLKGAWDVDGVELETLGGRNAWMVSRGRGVMLAGVVARMFKQLPLQDWLTYCDRHGMPAFIGKTRAASGTDGWNQMMAAVRSIGSEFGAVINVDDVIDVLDLKGQGELPYEKLVDRMDRAQIMLWRGGDLSTISRTGGAVGANPQHEETDELDADNAAWVSETLNANLTERVVRYHFGSEAPVLVELRLRTKTRDNVSQDLATVAQGQALGVRISRSWFTKKFGLVEAEDDEPALGDAGSRAANAPAGGATAANAAAATDETLDPLMERIGAALAEDMRPLGDALASAAKMGDAEAMRAALQKISRNLPDMLGGEALPAVLADEFAGALLGGAATAAANAGTSDGAIKGWETRRHNGWQAKPKAANEEIVALVDDALDHPEDPSDRIALFGDVGVEEARLLGLAPGFKRGMSRHSIRHIFKSHGDPKVEASRGQIAITRDDIARIPEFIAKSTAAVHSGTKGNVQTIRYYLDDKKNGTTTIVDEVRAGRRRLIPVQLMKFKKPGVRLPLKKEGEA